MYTMYNPKPVAVKCRKALEATRMFLNSGQYRLLLNERIIKHLKRSFNCNSIQVYCDNYIINTCILLFQI